MGISKKITSHKDLCSVISEEALKLDIDPSEISAFFQEPGMKLTYRQGKHRISFPLPATRQQVRHELYHVYKQDISHDSPARYLLLEEPRAIIYGLFGIKL